MRGPSAPGLSATLMRGGARKALFLLGRELPARARDRDALIARLLGCPDPSGAQLDGVGGGSAETSRVVVVTPSLRDECDIDAQFGAVDPREGCIDWSVGESDLLAAAGLFALLEGLHPCAEGVTRVRIWHAGARARVDALVPVRAGEVLQGGAFSDEGVPFAGIEIRLEFLDPTDGGRGGPLLPDGAPVQQLVVPGLGSLDLTLLGGGWPAVLVRADRLGLTGRETLAQLERDRRLKARCQAVLAAAASRLAEAGSLGPQSPLFAHVDPAAAGGGEPALVWVAPPAAYRARGGPAVDATEIDLLARAWVDGRPQPGLALSAAVAVAIAAALPGSVVHGAARTLPGVPTRIGAPGGPLAVGADLVMSGEHWRVEKVALSHGARRLMSGRVFGAPA
jgi:2-methylaconitate cis-trans-isomerase PrpF